MAARGAGAAGRNAVDWLSPFGPPGPFAYQGAAGLHVDALVIGDDPFFVARQIQLVALASRHIILATYQFREFAAVGGLASYGPSLTATMRQAGIYAGRIVTVRRWSVPSHHITVGDWWRRGSGPVDRAVERPVRAGSAACSRRTGRRY
jgi:hypothetical protein